MNQFKELTIDISLDNRNTLKGALLDIFGEDMDTYNNMSIYTHVWSSEFNPETKTADNGFTAETVDEWTNKLIEILRKEDDVYAALMDHVKYDGQDHNNLYIYIH
jgi:hypothetical protein